MVRRLEEEVQVKRRDYHDLQTEKNNVEESIKEHTVGALQLIHFPPLIVACD